MCIVTLEDGTTYNIDTKNTSKAETVVYYKLKKRMDFRKIAKIQEVKGAVADTHSRYYNSDNEFDGIPLNWYKP